MNLRQPDRPHIVFLFSDTGGGHRSAAEAIIEAIQLEFPGQIETEMVDIFRQYTPPPFSKAPEIYPPLTRVPDLWGFGYRVSNSPMRTRFITNMVWPYVRRGLHRLVKDHRCDLIVSLHQLSNAPVLRAMRKEHIPFVTVVLDMVSTHAFWYDNRADQVVVPTEAARQVGMKCGVDGQKMTVVGLPVAERFCRPRGDRATLRKSLGWPQDRPIVLMVGGGDGMGPLEQTAVAIDNLRLDAALMVVCGRNQKLKETLEERTWNTPTKIFGFVRDMPTFMRASDILVTKAGPGTISEAFIAELPMVLYSRLPGQEDGNVGYVEDQGAGIWAPEPDLAAYAVRRWLLNPNEYRQAVAACKRLARPNASRDIAKLLAAQVGVTHPASPQTTPDSH